MKENVRDLLGFIHRSPSPYHVVRNLEEMLAKAGFTKLSEGKDYRLEKGGSYYVSRNGSALIAFRIPGSIEGFSIVSAHTDSPSFRVKDNPEIRKDGYITLNVEGYGGMLLAPWFDRPLSLAGRVCIEENGKVACRLVNLDRDLVMIPSLAIHMNRNANHGIDYNVQKELMPLIGQDDDSFSLRKLVAKEIGVDENDLLESDLFLYNREEGKVWGLEDAYFSSPKIDDLECTYSAVTSLIASKPEKTIAVCALFDNEEVGSGTKQGALSDFLSETLERISLSLGWSREESLEMQSRSFMLSADNGHAVHPNYPEACDPTNRPKMGGGVLVKFAANQKYTSDAHSASCLEHLLRKQGIPYQVFFNNSNIPGGSTLGNLSTRHYSLPTVDIGVAQLAMHSPYETASCADLYFLAQAMHSFYERDSWLVVDSLE